MKYPFRAAAFAAGALFCATSAYAQQEEGKWEARIRALYMSPANKSTDPTGTLGSNTIHLSNKVFPEIDISYFFTKNLAAELILTYPQKHDVTLNGTKIGTATHLPPTLTGQYHFLPDSQFRPYVGAGVNYTRITGYSLQAGTTNLNLTRNSWGPALQVGMDIKVAQNSFINFDIKKVWIQTDVSANGTKLSTLNIDPLLVSVGYGFKF